MATALFTRWFQSKIFTPGFRLPADGSAGESWGAPAPTQQVLVDFLRLRKRLSPYVESTGVDRGRGQAGEFNWLSRVSLGDYARLGEHLNGFSFGPALFVQPSPAGDCVDLPVSLPAGSVWLDFWTGAAYGGDQIVRVPAPISRLPLFVRAGSILPLSAVDPTDPAATTIELRIYPGANGSLALLDSPVSGDAGPPVSIPLEWDDRARVLRIGACVDAAVLRSAPRRFYVVIVRPGHGIGHLPPPRPDQWVAYDGSELRLSFSAPPPRPAPPLGLSATVQSGRIHFTWRRSSEGLVYRLKRTPGVTCPCVDVASALLTPEHTTPAPAPGSTFSYVVTALNAGGESAPSEPFTVAMAPRSPLGNRAGWGSRGACAQPSADVRRPVDDRPGLVALGLSFRVDSGARSKAGRTGRTADPLPVSPRPASERTVGAVAMGARGQPPPP